MEHLWDGGSSCEKGPASPPGLRGLHFFHPSAGSTSLRQKCEIALVVLPVGLMIGSFLPLWYIARLLAPLLNIPGPRPRQGSAPGLLWLILFLIAMVSLIAVGASLGVYLSRLILRSIFGDRAGDPMEGEDTDPGEDPLYDPQLDFFR